MKKNKKLISVISILLIIGFFVTSLASYFVSRKSLRSEIENNTLPLTGDNIYSEIQRDLLKPVFISSLMASDTFLRDWILTGEVDQKNITKFLKEIKHKYNTITAFLVSDKTKTYYHANGILKKVAMDNPRDEWYFRVQQMEKEYEINVDQDMANQDTMTIFVNYRVYDYAGNYIGATGVGLTVNAVKSLIEEYQKKYDRSIFFVAEDGEIKLAGSNFPQAIVNIHQKKNFPIYSAEKIEQNNYYRYKDGSQLIHSNIRYITEFGWYLVVEQKESKTTRRILTTLFINLTICVFITFIVIALIRMTFAAYHRKIETLSGIVPICSYCKQIRDDKGYWNQVEEYVSKHTEAEFSHGICPDCMGKHYPEYDINK
jgi:hypothetical protein